MTDCEPWLGHRDLCSIQWSDYCDCEPGEPVDLFKELDLMADEEDDE